MKEQIAEFAAKLANEAAADPFFADMVHVGAPDYTVSYGKKYAKIIQGRGEEQRSVWGFIDMATGDILKAAGWSRPAKHARGNIATAVYGKNYAWTGPAYLR